MTGTGTQTQTQTTGVTTIALLVLRTGELKTTHTHTKKNLDPAHVLDILNWGINFWIQNLNFRLILSNVINAH